VSGCRVTKVLVRSEDARARVEATSPGLAACIDPADFWRDLDAVSVCSPDATHADYVAEALGRGLHVLCEKPLTDSVEGVRKIAAAARAAPSQVVAVMHQMRFVPVHRRIKACLEARELGTVSYMQGLYVHDLTELKRDDWRLKGDGASPLVYSGCHFVDLLRWLAQEEIVEVYAAGNHRAWPEYPQPDLSLVTLRFASGVIGEVLVAFGAACPQDHSVKVYGNEGAVENNVLYGKGGVWRRTLHSPRVIHRKLLRNPVRSLGQDLVWQLRGNLPSYAHAKLFELLRPLNRDGAWQYGVRFYPVRLYEHFLASVETVQDFVDAVRDGRPATCGVEDAARTVLACLAGAASQTQNMPVRVPRLTEVLS
jgi:predicted dehydrogenase